MTKKTRLCCPICFNKLKHVEHSLICLNKHTFDYAKEGYIHLLPSQFKSSLSPGDNKIMIKSRKSFLENQYYNFLIPELVEIINLQIKGITDPVILDVGCGEGFFIDQIQHQISLLSYYAMDISKDAIRLAAKRNKNIQWFVSSSNNIPIQCASLDLVLKINAPINYENLQKKLSANAIVISVSPGETHLCKLREILYLKPQLHKKEKTPGNFTLIQSLTVEQEIEISTNRDIQNLFLMTPYYWNASETAKEKVADLETLKTTAAFNINLYQLQNNRNLA